MEKMFVMFYGDKIIEKSLVPALLKEVPDNYKTNLFVISDHHRDDNLFPLKRGLEIALDISSTANNLVIFCSGAAESFIYYGEERKNFLELISRKNVTFFQIPFRKEKLIKTYHDLLKRATE